MSNETTLAEQHIAAFQTDASGSYLESIDGDILTSDPESYAAGRVDFVDGSAIEWDMDGAWAAAQ